MNEFEEEEEVKTPSSTSITRNVPMNDTLAAKGVTTTVKRTHLRHNHFVECLEQLTVLDVQQNLFRSRNHTITSISVKKVGLSGFDNKRWILDDGVHTLAHGHWRTQEHCI